LKNMNSALVQLAAIPAVDVHTLELDMAFNIILKLDQAKLLISDISQSIGRAQNSMNQLLPNIQTIMQNVQGLQIAVQQIGPNIKNRLLNEIKNNPNIVAVAAVSCLVPGAQIACAITLSASAIYLVQDEIKKSLFTIITYIQKILPAISNAINEIGSMLSE